VTVHPIAGPPTGGGLATPLTDRELQILRMVSLGWTHAEIAHALSMTPKGVTPAMVRAIRKLGASNAPHAVLLACRAGLLDGRPQRHGDHAGFRAHERRGEDAWACGPCAEGERAYRAGRKQARDSNAA
jgi:DNA-binding CsgD family transcriptional regulator